MVESNGFEGAPIPPRLGQRMEQPASIFSISRMADPYIWTGFTLMAVILAWLVMNELRFQARVTASAEATVVGHAEVPNRRNGGRRKTPTAIYAFRTAGGQEVRVEAVHMRLSFLKPEPTRGRIMLRYDPADPRRAQEDSPDARWGDIWLVSLFILILIVMTCWTDETLMAWRAFRLSRRGIVVEARIGRVRTEEREERRGQKAAKFWIIETHGRLPETGQDFECASFPLSENPHLFIAAGRETLPVLIDPKHPERNLLIADFLPLLPDFGLRARADAVWEERPRVIMADEKLSIFRRYPLRRAR
jgi:hypothetical protein